MEVQLQAKFLGVSRRLGKPDDEGKRKAYVEVSLATVRRTSQDVFGLAATELRADPAIFTSASKLEPFTAVVVYVEQTEYRRDGGTETVSIVVGIEPAQVRKAA